MSCSEIQYFSTSYQGEEARFLVIDSNVAEISQAKVIVLGDTCHYDETIQKMNGIILNAMYVKGDVIVVERSVEVSEDFSQIKGVEKEGKIFKPGDDPIKNQVWQAKLTLPALSGVMRPRNRTLSVGRSIRA